LRKGGLRAVLDRAVAVILDWEVVVEEEEGRDWGRSGDGRSAAMVAAAAGRKTRDGTDGILGRCGVCRCVPSSPLIKIKISFKTMPN
jgi:hypothetical protein